MYQLQLNSAQAYLLVRVLDVYTRMGVGQFDRVLEEMMYLHPGPHSKPTVFDDDSIAKPMLEYKQLLTQRYSFRDSYGICHPKVHIEAKNATDIMNALQECIAKNDESVKPYSCWHHAATVKHGDNPMPTIQFIGESHVVTNS